MPDAHTPAAVVPLTELPDGWEAATRFHQLKRTLPARLRRKIEDRAIDEILRRARDLLRHAHRPLTRVEDTLPHPGELDLDATLERPRPWTAQDLRLSRQEPKEADVIVILDMSLSMTGPKIALTALAAAILRLKLDRLAALSFDTTPHRLVAVGETVAARELVRRVLTVPALGYTNIEAGLRMGANELRRSRLRDRVGIIMTDGVANIGRNPEAMARRFPRLHVVQVGPSEPRGERCCKDMARAGRGRRYRAETYEELPAVVQRLVHECFGG